MVNYLFGLLSYGTLKSAASQEQIDELLISEPVLSD